MELFDEDFNMNKKTDNRRITIIIVILIIFLLITMLGILGVMIYLKQNTLTVKLNGQESNKIKNIIKIEDEVTGKVYIPIKQIASIFDYDAYDGSYTTKSEEPNQCHVEGKNEVAMFSLGSKKIYKSLLGENTKIEYYTIDSPVKSIEGELYTTIDGIEKAFNVSWDYNTDEKKMQIYTMDYLINAYSKYVTDAGYTAISQDFTNQKAILNSMLVVEKGENSTNKKMGVLDVSESEFRNLLEPKYEDIKYLEHTQDFLITSNGKKGIISSSRQTKVSPQYDDIELMDYDKKLYAVKNSGKYGVIDFYGKKIINTDYNEIGIDISKFKENNITSKYIIADNLIPLKRDNVWGFFNTKGEKVTDFKYDSIGYITSNNKAGSGYYSLLSVPEYNVVVVEKDGKYTIITTDGKEVWSFVFDGIYLQNYGGNTSYILDYDSKTYNLLEQLDGLGYGKTKNKDYEAAEEETEEDNNNNNQSKNNTNSSNTNSNKKTNTNNNNTNNTTKNSGDE